MCVRVVGRVGECIWIFVCVCQYVCVCMIEPKVN